MICKLAIGEISTFSVVEETNLKLALSETPKTGFVVTRLFMCHPANKISDCGQLI